MGRIEALTSPANPLLKDVRQALARGALTKQGCVVAEGPHLLEEALRSDVEIRLILASESAKGRVRRPAGVRLAVVADNLFTKLAGTESSQGVITLVQPPVWSLDQLFHRESPLIVLDGLQDPGNAGSIIR